jgi:tetratricopeptide (TPR) repeat protein
MTVLRSQSFKPAQSKRSLSADLQGYIDVCDSYMAVFPNKPGSLDCQLDISEIYLKTNNTDQAEKRLAILAKQRSGSKEGKTAAEFLLLLAKDDKNKLAATTNSLLAIPQYTTGDLGKRLNEIKRAGRFDEVKSLETSGKFEQAAQEFERLGSDRSYSKADTALFNAGVNYRLAKKFDKSIQAFQRIITDFPKSQLVEGALLEIIDMASGRLQLQFAVNYVDMFLARFPKSPKAAKLLAGACTYYDALSQTERAKQACTRVIGRGGSAAEVAAESLAGVYERSGRHSEFVSFAESTLMRLAKGPSAQIELWHRIKESAEKSGNKAKALEAQKQILGIYSRNKKSVTGPALSYVASFAFANEFSQIEKFRREVLTGGKSGAEFQSNIMKRNAALKALTDRFTSVAQDIGDAEWSVASLYVIGFAHELVASELLNPPQPPGITGEAWQKVKESLAGLGAQFQSKAKGYYVSAGGIVSKFNIYSEYGQKILDSLARLEPSKFRKADDFVPSVLFVGTQVEDSSNVKNALEPRG